MTADSSCTSRGQQGGSGHQQKVIQYNCPTCGRSLDNPSHMAGRNDECDGCGYVHLVPAEDSCCPQG